MAERPYGVDDMVAKVAAGQEFVVDPTKVGIVFFGFSKIQKDSERHTTMIDRLKRGKIAVVAAGEAKGIELNWKRGAK
jgi:hypothetical protein